MAPQCDIVLLVWNHLELTTPCIESILRCTQTPCRLLIVDNDSDEETKTYLRSVRGNDRVAVEVVFNSSNEGFVGGMNRGIERSTAPYVCLLNNDTVVTSGWLSRMIGAVETLPEAGVANPVSNTFGERPAPGQSLEAYAAQIVRRGHEMVEVGHCIGFCMLIKRAVIDVIGGLDGSLDRFFFEDSDYGFRAAQAGFLNVVVRSAYVWHDEHRSVSTLPEREAIFQANQRRFWERWGKPVRAAYVVDPSVTTDHPAFGRAVEQAVRLARRHGFVALMYRDPAHGRDVPSAASKASGEGASSYDLFTRHGLRPHANVWLAPYRRSYGYAWHVLYRIAKRRKKPFDVALLPEQGVWRRVAAVIRWLGVEAVSQHDVKGLEAAWERRSRFPSLS